ncbi:MAG: rhamnulokinase, partial [Anaerolineae bacterium]|nr:rhamnulokinase [Anaerolineae bacterium]
AKPPKKAVWPPIASIGIDTWAVDFGLLDANDALIANPYHYRDSHTDGILEQAFTRMPRAEIYQHTGLQFLQFNTLYQLFAMQQANAPALRATRSLLMIPDLFHFWLTGVKACEFTNATTTQFFNPRTNAWSHEVLDALNIPHNFLVDVVPPGTTLGHSRRTRCATWG